MTPQDICDLIDTHNRIQDENNRRAAVFAWHTAHLTAIAVNNPKRYPKTPEEYFPWLDDKPAWVRSKERMAQFAAKHNAKISGGGKA